jgi:hypothetical protein
VYVIHETSKENKERRKRASGKGGGEKCSNEVQ